MTDNDKAVIRRNLDEIARWFDDRLHYPLSEIRLILSINTRPPTPKRWRYAVTHEFEAKNRDEADEVAYLIWGAAGQAKTRSLHVPVETRGIPVEEIT